jgi:membrane protein implicated in regulation of membrane protease activity
MDWLGEIAPHYVWLALGLFLAAAEILVPGFFLMWLAGAAILTGLVSWFLPIGVPLQIVVFAVSAFIAVFAGKRLLKDHPVHPADPMMNQRGLRITGETAVVVEALVGGSGRVRHGDSEWLARGADLPVGTRVRITGSDGSVLLVEPFA